MPVQSDDYITINRGGTPGDGSTGTHYVEQLKSLAPLFPIAMPLGGQFLLDPNEVNGWTQIGPTDNSVTGKWFNYTVAQADTISTENTLRNLGGFVFPFDVKLVQFDAIHDINNTAAGDWGWVILNVDTAPIINTNTAPSYTYLLNEASGLAEGPRSYTNTRMQTTSVTTTTNVDVPTALLPDVVIPAGNMVSLGVATQTTDTTNRYVRIRGGTMIFERSF